MTPQEFAAKIRTKYPNAYTSIDDETLARKVVEKYPQYASQVTFEVPGIPQTVSSVLPEQTKPSLFSRVKDTAISAASKFAGILPGALGPAAEAATSFAARNPKETISMANEALPGIGAIAAGPAAPAGAIVGAMARQGGRALLGQKPAQPVSLPLVGNLPEIPGVGPAASELLTEGALGGALQAVAGTANLVGRTGKAATKALLDFAADVKSGTAATAAGIKIPKFNLSAIKQYGSEVAGAIKSRSETLGSMIDGAIEHYDSLNPGGKLPVQTVTKQINEFADSLGKSALSAEAKKAVEDALYKISSRVAELTQGGTKANLGALDTRNLVKELDSFINYGANPGPGQKEGAKLLSPLRLWVGQQLGHKFPMLAKATSDYGQLIKDTKFLDFALKTEGTGEITDEIASQIQKSLPRFLKSDKILTEQLAEIGKRLGSPAISKGGTGLAVAQQLSRPAGEGQQGLTSLIRSAAKPIGRAMLPTVSTALEQVGPEATSLAQIIARYKREGRLPNGR